MVLLVLVSATEHENQIDRLVPSAIVEEAIIDLGFVHRLGFVPDSH